MVIAADYPLLEIIATIGVFFLWVIWIWTLVVVLTDVFRRDDLSGWGKGGWTALIIFVPFLGVLAYLIGHGKEMGERQFQAAEQQLARQEKLYGRRHTEANGAAHAIAEAKQLLDSGTIDQAEFEQLKRKALS